MMKYLSGALLLFLLFVSPVAAQDSEDEAVKRYNITFPIEELGGCDSLSACKTYCDDAANQETCVAFAKKKGFYNEMKADERRERLVEDAKNELGCTSETECRSYCSSEANRERCVAFAKKHGFDGEKKEAEIVQKAKSSLGCDSYESCKAYCELEANRERCSNFAKGAGISRDRGTTEKEEMRKREEMMRQGKTGTDSAGPSPTGQPQSKEDYCRQYPERCREGGMETDKSTIDYPPGYPTTGTSPTTKTTDPVGGSYPADGTTYPATDQPGGTGVYPTTNQVVSPAATGAGSETQVQGMSTQWGLWERLKDFLGRFRR